MIHRKLVIMLPVALVFTALVVEVHGIQNTHSAQWYEAHDAALQIEVQRCTAMSQSVALDDKNCTHADQARTAAMWDQKIAPLNTGKQF